jgi:hypothetical protein
VVIWEAYRAEAAQTKGRAPSRLWMRLSHTRLVPVPAEQGSSCSTWSWSPAGPDGRGKSKGWESSYPTCSWGSAGSEGQWALLGGIPASPGNWVLAGVQCGWVAGIPMVMDVAVWPRGVYSSVVWVRMAGSQCGLGAGIPPCVGLARGCGWHNPRDRGP